MTQRDLKLILSYDPKTGVFVHLKTRGKAKAGEAAGWVDSDTGYVKIGIEGRNYLAHRLAWLYVNGSWPTKTIDHENRIRTDNRFSNLREATRVQQMGNLGHSGQRSRSGVRGVYPHGKRWVVNVGGKDSNGRYKTVYIGIYDTIKEAEVARLKAAQAKYGQYHSEWPSSLP